MDENFIPSTLEECFDCLDRMLLPEDIDVLKSGSEKDTGRHHFGFGMWMRNNWGLWHGGPLRDWFNNQDVWHADDMSSIILVSYWRRLNRQPINLEEQVKHFSEFWADQGVDIKEECLKCQNK